RQAFASPCFWAYPHTAVLSSALGERPNPSRYAASICFFGSLLIFFSRSAKNSECFRTNGLFMTASACNAVSVVLRTGVLMFGSAQSRLSRKGLGTLRTTKRYTVRRHVFGSVTGLRSLWSYTGE